MGIQHSVGQENPGVTEASSARDPFALASWTRPGDGTGVEIALLTGVFCRTEAQAMRQEVEVEVKSATKQVFLSYAQRDRELAEAVAAELQLRGVPVRDSQMSGGSEWASKVDDALHACDSMIALLNANAFSSRYVRQELEFALFSEQYKNRLLPVLLEEASSDLARLPWILSKIQAMRMTRITSPEAAAKKIVDEFAKLMEKSRSEL